MKILIILLLSIKVSYLLELDVTPNRINKGLISNCKKYDAEMYPYAATTSLSTFKNDTDYQYDTCTGSLVKQKYVLTSTAVAPSWLPAWLNKVNTNNIKVSKLVRHYHCN